MEIRSRSNGAIMYSSGGTLSGLAAANKANLRGADFRGANLVVANLGGASLVDADLGGADLRRADIGDANLGRAFLRCADLRGAKRGDWTLTGSFCQIGSTCEWGPMLAYEAKGCGLRITVGCRDFSLAEAKAHWAERADRPLTRAAVAMAEVWYEAECAKRRLWVH